MAKLIFLDDSFAGRPFEFLMVKTTVGRSGDNTLVIHHDSVSHHHCEILVNGKEVIVHDLGSKNGTFVEGRRLHNEQSQLKDGQVVRFGTVGARLELGTPTQDTQEVATDITTVRALNKFAREVSKEKHPPQTGPKAMELGAGGDEGEQTVLLKRQERPRPITTPLAQEDLGEARKKRTMKIVLIVAAIFVVGLAVVLWSLLRQS